MIVDNTLNVITITFDDTEMTLVNWINDNYGSNEIATYLSNFLVQKQAQMDETLKSQLWEQVKDDPEAIQTAIATAKARKGLVIR